MATESEFEEPSPVTEPVRPRPSVAVEVATRGAKSRAVREADLRDALDFARQHLAAPTPVKA